MRSVASGVVAGILVAEIAVAALLAWAYVNGKVIIFEYPADLASVMLTAAAVILTAATLIIALMAVWGVQDFRDRAKDAAKEEAQAYIKTDEFRALVYRAAQDYLRYDEEAGVDDDKTTNAMAEELMKGDDHGNGGE